MFLNNKRSQEEPEKQICLIREEKEAATERSRKVKMEGALGPGGWLQFGLQVPCVTLHLYNQLLLLFNHAGICPTTALLTDPGV